MKITPKDPAEGPLFSKHISVYRLYIFLLSVTIYDTFSVKHKGGKTYLLFVTLKENLPRAEFSALNLLFVTFMKDIFIPKKPEQLTFCDISLQYGIIFLLFADILLTLRGCISYILWLQDLQYVDINTSQTLILQGFSLL